MRKLGATGIAAALCAGLALATARADDGDGGDLRSMPTVKPSWWSGTFGSKEPAVEAKKLPPAEVLPVRVSQPSDPATVQAREQAAYIRRSDVCDELLAIAEKKGDEALREQVYQLQDRVWAVYLQRTATTASRIVDVANATRPAQPGADAGRQSAVRNAAPANLQGEQP